MSFFRISSVPKFLVVVLLLLFVSAKLPAQDTADVPSGIRIKRASATDNAAAQAKMQQALSDDSSVSTKFLAEVVTCGPTLWAALRPSADETMLGSKVISVVLPEPVALTVPARGLVTRDQRGAFWKLLLSKYPQLKVAKLRKPTSAEFQYYWATIPFESIEEPFFAIEAGSQVFVANTRIDKGIPVLFWIDLVGDLHALGDKDLTGDEVKEFESGAEAGLPLPMYTVGRAYLLGRGVAVDLDKGKKWLDSAAQAGSLEAQMFLWSAYGSSKFFPKDTQLSAKYLLQAAQHDHVTAGQKSALALAQLMAAMMFEQGTGVEKSHEKAIQFLQLAAMNGNYNAQFELGNLFNQGLGGIALDKTRACELFEAAADQGHRQAIHNTGYCYQTGSGGKKDFDKAKLYYTKAAEVGEVRSQYNLGLLYGQLEQAEKSYFWLRVAELSGGMQNNSALDAVKAQLTASQIETVEKQIAEWIGSHTKKAQ